MLNIVLLEPEMPANTGNIGRTCVATNTRLHLIEPLGFRINDKMLKRAGLDYWHQLDITYYENSDEFFEKNKDEQMFFFSTKAPVSHVTATYPKKVFLVFGKETKGLPEELLKANIDKCRKFSEKVKWKTANKITRKIGIPAHLFVRILSTLSDFVKPSKGNFLVINEE